MDLLNCGFHKSIRLVSIDFLKFTWNGAP